MKRILFSILFIPAFFSQPAVAQDLTGIWRGYFITESMEQYRYEIQLEQLKNNALSGVTYSYLDKRFYGKATFTGNFNKSSQNALVQEIKTIEVRMSLGSYSCIQKCQLTYVKSGREEFLEGTFTSSVELSDSAFNVKRGDDCGGGRMYLRKVASSDFYVEPFLRKKPTPQAPPVVKNNTQTKPPVTQKTTTTPKTNTETKTETNKPKQDVITKTETPSSTKEKEIKTKPIINPPAILKSRENNLIQTISVNTEKVTIRLYDNGEIDDDTISVYLNNKLILSKQRLTASALTLTFTIDESDPEQELVMVAENLGRIPPNTSLMIVNAGDTRHEVRITSTEQKNAVVRFKYVKPKPPLPLP